MTAKALLLATAMLCVTAILVAVILVRDEDDPGPTVSEQCAVLSIC